MHTRIVLEHTGDGASLTVNAVRAITVADLVAAGVPESDVRDLRVTADPELGDYGTVHHVHAGRVLVVWTFCSRWDDRVIEHDTYRSPEELVLDDQDMAELLLEGAREERAELGATETR